jgi:hypothetical protein
VHLALKIVWSAALLVIVVLLGWFILSPATNFLAAFGTETQIGMLFVFTWIPSIVFLIISSAQLFKSWHQSTGTSQIVWTIVSVIYAIGLGFAQWGLFVAS